MLWGKFRKAPTKKEKVKGGRKNEGQSQKKGRKKNDTLKKEKRKLENFIYQWVPLHAGK